MLGEDPRKCGTHGPEKMQIQTKPYLGAYRFGLFSPIIPILVARTFGVPQVTDTPIL